MRGPTGAKRGAYVSWLEFLGGRLFEGRSLQGQFTSKGQYEGQNLVSKYHEATNSDEDHVKLAVYLCELA
jgi:hypothetical protein